MFIIPVIRMEGIGDLTDLEKDNTAKTVPEKRFDSVLKGAVRETDRAIKDTQVMSIKLTSEQVGNLHTALIQAEKTTATVKFTTQITTKAMDAYNQIMGM